MLVAAWHRENFDQGHTTDALQMAFRRQMREIAVASETPNICLERCGRRPKSPIFSPSVLALHVVSMGDSQFWGSVP